MGKRRPTVVRKELQEARRKVRLLETELNAMNTVRRGDYVAEKKMILRECAKGDTIYLVDLSTPTRVRLYEVRKEANYMLDVTVPTLKSLVTMFRIGTIQRALYLRDKAAISDVRSTLNLSLGDFVLGKVRFISKKEFDDAHKAVILMQARYGEAMKNLKIDLINLKKSFEKHENPSN